MNKCQKYLILNMNFTVPSIWSKRFIKILNKYNVKIDLFKIYNRTSV